MSHGPENTFIAAVHRHLPPALYRMKNHNQYNSGIADCWYSGATRDLWIEWKYVSVPAKREGVIDLIRRPSLKTPPILTELQQEWLRERTREGRHVWVGVGCKDGGVLFTSPYGWEAPISALGFREQLASRKDLAMRIAGFVG